MSQRPKYVNSALKYTLQQLQLKPSLHFEPFCLRILASLPCHVVLDLHRDIATFQYDVAHAFPLFLPQITCSLVKPRRIGLPTRHRCLPIRRGSRFFSLFASNYSLPCRATSRWTSNATSLPPNTTWLTFFRPFSHTLLASLPSHVVLEVQRDVAAFQHDVAPLFTPKNHPRYTGGCLPSLS